MKSLVTAQWLFENLHKNDLILLDASQPDNKSGLVPEFTNVCVPNARFFDLKGNFSDPSNGLPNMLPSPEAFQVESRKLGINTTSKIVIYDNLGVYSSPRVWWMFRIMGHQNISVLDGGLSAWIHAGFPTVSEHELPKDSGDFVANFKPDQVVDYRQVQGNIDDPKAVVIDARSEERFAGITPEPRAGMRSGHIPKSINIPFEAVLTNGHYKSKAELQELFAGKPVQGKPLVFSCGSGLTACIVLLAAEQVMENHTAVYDGSWTEWSQLEHLPVE